MQVFTVVALVEIHVFYKKHVYEKCKLGELEAEMTSAVLLFFSSIEAYLQRTT